MNVISYYKKYSKKLKCSKEKALKKEMRVLKNHKKVATQKYKKNKNKQMMIIKEYVKNICGKLS